VISRAIDCQGIWEQPIFSAWSGGGLWVFSKVNGTKKVHPKHGPPLFCRVGQFL
jgi:hypothetical protein